VSAAVIVDSSPHQLDAGCLPAILRWKFRPGRERGHVVSFWAKQTFSFAVGTDRRWAGTPHSVQVSDAWSFDSRMIISILLQTV
jgi:hypothetical protein